MDKQRIQTVKQRFGIIGISSSLDRNIDISLQVAPTDLSVLITGESGVGKENFPQIIHQFSRRKHGPYIAINCGSIPEGTIDSELFGHEKGSFTGATGSRKGYFEAANKGTIFLDEVGELPLSTQARLLRVLETGEYLKVGSSAVESCDVRIIAATNVNILEAIEKGKFREDLYFRLNSVPIRIAPLRDRKEDIPLLFKKFTMDFSDKYMMPIIELTPEALDLLKNYNWPGNVRQLKNIAEQISILEKERLIGVDTLEKYLPKDETNLLPIPFTGQAQNNEEKFFSSEREILYQILFDMKRDMTEMKSVIHKLMQEKPIQDIDSINSTKKKTPLFHDVNISDRPHVELQTPDQKENDAPKSLEEIEKEVIRKSLIRNQGKRKIVAEELKISERTLYRKIKDYNLEDL